MATVLTSYSLVPELQHWFNRFIINSEVSKNLIPPPVDISELYMPVNSFIDMLFNDNYSKSTYEYRYIDETNLLCIPRIAFERIQVYPGSSKYLILDASGENIFNLQQQDFYLLDALLAYRNGATDATSLVIIDSTSVNFIADATAGIYILYANLSALQTKLSQLIYLYLILKIQDRYQEYNNESLITDGNLVDSCYEAYLIDQYFLFMTIRHPDLIYDCGV
jgi:hypothetical protein